MIVSSDVIDRDVVLLTSRCLPRLPLFRRFHQYRQIGATFPGRKVHLHPHLNFFSRTHLFGPPSRSIVADPIDRYRRIAVRSPPARGTRQTRASGKRDAQASSAVGLLRRVPPNPIRPARCTAIRHAACTVRESVYVYAHIYTAGTYIDMHTVQSLGGRVHIHTHTCARARARNYVTDDERRTRRTHASEPPFRSIPFHSKAASTKLSPLRISRRAPCFFRSGACACVCVLVCTRARSPAPACSRVLTLRRRSPIGDRLPGALADWNAFSFRKPAQAREPVTRRDTARAPPRIIGNYRKLILDRKRPVGVAEVRIMRGNRAKAWRVGNVLLGNVGV